MGLWPLGLYAVLAILVVAAMLGLSYLLGERHRERATDIPYESGILPSGSARVPFPSDYYLIALFFVIFDLEAVFLLAWAVAARRLGWLGYVEIVIFVVVLVAALVYLWRDGALDWGTTAELKQRARARREGARR